MARCRSTCIKMDKKLRQASQTTIFSRLRSIISGFTNGQGSAPGNCRKITRRLTPSWGAAMAAAVASPSLPMGKSTGNLSCDGSVEQVEEFQLFFGGQK